MPLNASQINGLVLEFKKEQNLERRDTLFEQILASQEGMINSFITQKARSMSEEQDLRQELLITTLEAINKYKSSFGANFNTYLHFYLKRGKIVWKEKSSTIKVQRFAKEKDKHITFSDSKDIENTLADSFSWTDLDDIIDLNFRINKLPAKDIELVTLRIEGYSYQEIGNKIGMSNVKVSERFMNIIKLLTK